MAWLERQTFYPVHIFDAIGNSNYNKIGDSNGDKIVYAIDNTNGDAIIDITDVLADNPIDTMYDNNNNKIDDKTNAFVMTQLVVVMLVQMSI